MTALPFSSCTSLPALTTGSSKPSTARRHASSSRRSAAASSASSQAWRNTGSLFRSVYIRAELVPTSFSERDTLPVLARYSRNCCCRCTVQRCFFNLFPQPILRLSGSVPRLYGCHGGQEAGLYVLAYSAAFVKINRLYIAIII